MRFISHYLNKCHTYLELWRGVDSCRGLTIIHHRLSSAHQPGAEPGSGV